MSGSSDGEASVGSRKEIYLDLFCGIGGRHIRYLTENPMNGGCGIPISEVGKMTLDQVAGMLCEREMLSSGDGRKVKSIMPLELKTDSEGFVKGRTEDGIPIKARIAGKSKVKILLEQQKREEEEAAKKRRAEQRAERRKRREGRAGG